MNPSHLVRLSICVASLAGALIAQAQTTAFTYQGHLIDTGAPANGTYDLQFTLTDAATSGTAVAGPTSVAPVGVTNGLFTVQLDFGASAFNGNARWLAIGVRTNGSSAAYTTLAPRQAVTSSPYAIQALTTATAATANALNGDLPSAQLTGLYSSALTLSNPGNSFTGNGSLLTSLNASQLASGTVPAAALGNAWQLGGNSGTTPGTQFLGTLDNQALEFHVNNNRALRLEPNTAGAPNVLAGSPFNFVASGIVGAAIGGGGAINYLGLAFTNSILADFGTIGGGAGNTIQGNALESTIGGGNYNTIQGPYSVIGGGVNNTILDLSLESTISGGYGNIIQTNASYSVIGGGYENIIQTNASYSAIGGGYANTIQISAQYSVIGGGYANTIQTNAQYSTIGGGIANTIQTNAQYSAIGGGNQNTIQINAQYSTIGGGIANTIQTNAQYSIIGGGGNNTIQTNAFLSTIGGGAVNLIQTNAFYSTIGGGGNNTVQINAQYATVPGGANNVAGGKYSFAAGRNAQATNDGAFIWADSTGPTFSSTGLNQFLIRAAGGVGIGKNNPATALDVNGIVTATSFAGSGANLTGLSASSLSSGTYASVLTLNNAGNSFTGNGGGLTSLNASQLASGTVPATALGNAWQLGGNSGTTPGNQFLGTSDNLPLELHVNNNRALRLEPNTAGAPNVLAGSQVNFVGTGTVGAAIGGGGATNYFGSAYTNSILADFGTLSGGYGNAIRTGASGSTIGGGNANTIQTNASTSTIGGGSGNTIQTNAQNSTIGGGAANTIQTNSSYSTISGGEFHTIQTNAFGSTIGGGYNNTIQTFASSSTIGGGAVNAIQSNAYYSTIGGGTVNTIQTNAAYSTIGGGTANTIQTNATYSTIGGGNANTIQTNAASSAIGGGYANTIQINATYSTIGGGQNNAIQTNAYYSTIGGGTVNTIQINAYYSTIGGGTVNTIQTNAQYSTISGGYFNTIQTNATSSTIGGGQQNTIQTWSSYSAIGGGNDNLIQTNTSFSTIGGGNGNLIQTGAANSTIGGGTANTIQTNGQCAMVPGGLGNVAAGFAFAAGYHAQATNSGAFVWSDSTGTVTGSQADNSVTMRASGGFTFLTGTGVGGASLAAGGTSWTTISDRNAKKNFQAVDSADVLEKLAAMPVQHWNYKWEPDNAVPHLGPVAQDFKAAFYPGRDDKSISTLEFDGVELAAIQGLNKKVEAQKAELAGRRQQIESLQKQNDEFARRMAELERLVQGLAKTR